MSTTTGASTTLVASRRPPSPASSATASTPLSARASSAATVRTSNCVVSPSSSGSFAISPRTRVDRAAEHLGRDRRAVDEHALVVAGDVRREVGAGAQPVRPQDRGGVARRRRLAVGADDVDDAEAVLRPAERVEQRRDALQPRPHAEDGQAVEVGLPVARHGQRDAPRQRATRPIAHRDRRRRRPLTPGAARQPRGQLVAVGRVGGELLALLGDDRLRRLADERLVGELRRAALHLGLGLGELTLEAGDLLGRIDRRGDLEAPPGHQHHGGARLRRAVEAHLGARQGADRRPRTARSAPPRSPSVADEHGARAPGPARTPPSARKARRALTSACRSATAASSVTAARRPPHGAGAPARAAAPRRTAPRPLR